jgi:decaprenylphospho-beta-D-ribofuranose 2-oxidase
MSAERVVIDGIDGRPERLRSYSGLQEACAWVVHPDNDEQLRRIFRYAHDHKRRLTFRAGGRSFDAQSLGDDIVVSMDRFDTIEVFDDTVRVGAGATWGRILRTLEAYGRVPAVTVTTEHATAGGTMSGNCLSRFSAAYGKEGTLVRSFTLMTPDGTIHECERPTGEAATLADKLFLATIGGLGYLGAVLSITYEVLPAPEGAPPTVVETEVARVGDLSRYVDRFVDCVADMHAEDSTPLDKSLHDAVYSAVSLRADGDVRALVFCSTLRGAVTGRPLLVYEPHHRLRVPVEILFRFRAFNSLVWWLTFEVFHRRRRRFVNGLADFTFFMDGNGRAKRFASRVGIDLKTLQQTFVIPSDFDSRAGIEQTKEDLEAWLRAAAHIFGDRGIAPTFQDVLWLPHDLAFPLSTTAASGGFAVSYAFDSNIKSRQESAIQTLEALSAEVALRGGRVYLVKNVYAAPEALSEMYGDGAEEFLELKEEVDPGGVLRNPFFAEKLDADAA